MAKLGVIQTVPYGNDNQAIAEASRLLAEAGKQEADIVCLPEQWLSDNVVDDFGARFAEFGRIAREYSMCVIPGAFYHRTRVGADGARRTAIAAPVISADGGIAGMQEKIHPFSYERDSVSPGSAALVFEARGVRFGIIVCHDMVFAPVARTLARKGAQVICSPSRIVSRGVAPWGMYVQVRALENRIPIVAANVSGGRFGGGSMAVDLETDDGVVNTRVTRLADGQSYAVMQVEPGAYERQRAARYADENPFQ
ncbi:MAG: carbon-nitrogen hydrolase family protein [Thaumarchaeota archaeon]|nr:carbon-nitrogen hydrolase family protein [Nitrososphaerota archaeon]MDE0267235.1 carbon-nitrogen hydrolase family protein [Nitrososphaerota archaeon]MDE0525882.1 carbon-nitrogen hydrolase family protein [Nitrososphaerota archaeon]